MLWRDYAANPCVSIFRAFSGESRRCSPSSAGMVGVPLVSLAGTASDVLHYVNRKTSEKNIGALKRAEGT